MPSKPDTAMLIISNEHPAYNRAFPETLDTTLNFIPGSESPKGDVEAGTYTGMFSTADGEVQGQYTLKVNHATNTLETTLRATSLRPVSDRFRAHIGQNHIMGDRIILTYSSDLHTVRILPVGERRGYIDERYANGDLPDRTDRHEEEYEAPVPAPRERPASAPQQAAPTEQDLKKQADEQYVGEPVMLRRSMKYSPMQTIQRVIDRIDESAVSTRLLQQARSRARAITGTGTYVPIDRPGLAVPAERLAEFFEEELPARYRNLVQLVDVPKEEGEFRSLDTAREEFLASGPQGEVTFDMMLEDIASNEEFVIDESTYRRDDLVRDGKIHTLLLEHYKRF